MIRIRDLYCPVRIRSDSLDLKWKFELPQVTWFSKDPGANTQTIALFWSSFPLYWKFCTSTFLFLPSLSVCSLSHSLDFIVFSGGNRLGIILQVWCFYGWRFIYRTIGEACTFLLRVINIKFYSRKVECDISVWHAIKLHSFLVELVYLLTSFSKFYIWYS